MKNSPDQEILERAKRFEAQALEEIFDKYSPGIYRYAYRLLGEEDLARDCMSETFSRYLAVLKRGGGPQNYLQAYLYRIAHNWVTDFYRSKTPTTLALDADTPANPSDEPHNVMAEKIKQHQVQEALKLLTPDQRQVIVLKYLEDWESEMIAKTLNKPLGAVKSLQHRALESLCRILTRYEEMSG